VRIDELLAAGTTTSFEFFPPANDEEQQTLEGALGELTALGPSFVSVTYRGGAASRTRTFNLVQRLKHDGHLEPMAHLTCVHHTRNELVEILTDYREAGIENLMLLGGDVDPQAGAVGELRHASELVELAHSVGSFCVGVAAQPSGHPDSVDLLTDRRYLAAKLEAADFAVTQLFFELDEWCALRDELHDLGMDKPVLPGIMPITTLSSIDRMRAMGGHVPAWLAARLQDARGEGPGSVRAAGVAVATELCEGLLAAGAPGLHFYTLNRSTATREIVVALRGRDAKG
jgi:methylenetetrahydrofolate reductase (NADPH)